ncbi:MAG: TonB-dependent receptor [Bacteroidales bacterium]|nr:TonB-dependent receptor [Bacteroidales bacterium]
MKTYLLILSALILNISIAKSAGELTQTIRGTVVDAISGYPIIGAYVILLNSEPKVGVTTDVNGIFELRKVPLGRQSLQINCIGYEPEIYNNLMLVSGKEVILEVKLSEKVNNLGEVVIKASSKKAESQNELAIVSTRTFSVEETERFAGSLGDPARMVANYAGVMTQNDSRNDIIIRGNSPSGVLWRLEGIEIPNPNHFGAQGTTGGPVSMVNNNLLTNSDFLTGAFPAEYGNAIAGAFDINLRSGNSSEHEFIGQVGFNGFELGAEGPLLKLANGQKASYLASYRYSTLELLDKAGFNIGTGAAIPRYKDLTFLVDVPGTKIARLKLFGLWGTSFIALGRDLTDTTENQYNSRGVATDFEAGLAVIGLSHTYYFNDKTRIKSTLSWQNASSRASLDSIRNGTFSPYVRSNQAENKLSFSTQIRRKISAEDNVSIGLIIDNYGIAYLDSIKDREYNRFLTTTDINGNMMLYQAYAQWQHKSGGRLTTYSGMHFQYFGLNKELVAEPRLGASLTVSEKGTINAGIGLHSQIQPRVYYFYQEYNPLTDSYPLTNEDIKFTRSAHFVLGYQYMVNNDFRIKIESYYQHLYKVPVKASFPEFSMLNTGDQFGNSSQDSLVNTGKGKNYGVEITIEKFLSRNWYMLFTSSVFNSKYSGYDNIVRNTAFNGNYVFNLLGGYERKLGKHSIFTTDLKTVWAGGKRFVPIDPEASAARGEEVRDWSRAYKDQYDDYFRVDLRFGIRFNNKRFSQEWNIDLQNITGYRSIFMEGYDAKKGETYKVYQQGFVPMFLYRIQF